MPFPDDHFPDPGPDAIHTALDSGGNVSAESASFLLALLAEQILDPARGRDIEVDDRPQFLFAHDADRQIAEHRRVLAQRLLQRPPGSGDRRAHRGPSSRRRQRGRALRAAAAAALTGLAGLSWTLRSGLPRLGL